MVKRPKISLSLQRRVRQQCAFGCVFCGKPVFEYDHIIEYSKVKRHEFDNLVLLCREHHGPKTHHCVNIDLLRAKRLKPFNRDKAVSSPYGFPAGNNPYWVVIGDNKYGVKIPEGLSEYKFPALTINGQDIISVACFRDGDVTYSLPSIYIADENHEVIALIEDGESHIDENHLRVGLRHWDIECTDNKIVIRNEPRKIVLYIKYNATGMWLKRATLYDRKEVITVKDDGIHFEEGGRISEGYSVGCNGGIRL